MKKIFSVLATIAFSSLTYAQTIYEVGAEGNDNAMGIELTDTKDNSALVFDITLTNPTLDICAIQCFLKAPEGAEWTMYGPRQFYGITERGEVHSADGSAKVTNQSDAAHLGLYYVTVWDSKFTPFADKSGSIIQIKLDASTLADGDYEVELVDPYAATREAGYNCAGSSYAFTVANGTVTGINAVNADAEGATYYDANGIQQNGPKPGINIVKYANGTVQKVFIK